MTGREWVFPASFGQERTWLAEQQQPGSTVYTLPCHARIETTADAEHIVSSLRTIVGRHEALRTSVRVEDETLRQVVHEEVPVEVPVSDLRDRGLTRAAEEAMTQTSALAIEPLSVDAAPLWRAHLARLADDQWHLGFVVHHIVFDAGSWVLLRHELSELCEAVEQGREPQLPDLPIQYADFAAWQRQQQDESAAADNLAYWTRTLDGIPAVHCVPTDRTRPAQLSYDGGDVRFTLPDGLFDGVMAVAQKHRASPFMVLLAGFAGTVARLSGATDVVIGSTSAGRDVPQTASMLGMFINQLVLRTDCSGDPTFGALIDRVRDVQLRAMEHRETPFQTIVDAISSGTGRTPGVQPVYQLGFNYIPDSGLERVRYATTKDDLAIDITADDGRLLYRTDLFDATTAESMAQRYLSLMGAGVDKPDLRLSELPLVDPSEVADLLRRGRGTDRPNGAVAGSIPALVEAQDPDRVAVIDRSESTDDVTGHTAASHTTQSMTYGALNHAANRYAHRLRAMGVRPDDRVAVALAPSAELVAALLGVLKSGGGYVPLDPAHPGERLRTLQAECGATVLIASPDVPAAEGVAVLDPTAVTDGTTPDSDPEPVAGREHLAYALFTSGSTGTPKAVAVGRGNVAAYLAWARATYPGLRGTTLLHSPVSFDLTVTGLFGTLTSGGTVQLGALENAGPAGATFCKVTPSHLPLVSTLPGLLADDADLVIGGEALTGAVLSPYLAEHPYTRVTNEYGPTEATVGTVAAVLPTGADLPDGPVPIGEPVWNTNVYILDPALQPVPTGAVGELYLAGEQVARGYLGQPGQTADRFLPDPFGPAGTRMYRTGDLVRLRSADGLEFLGRADDQIALRGYRIEPGEVEAAMLSVSGVTQAAVTVREESPGSARLIGYVVGEVAADDVDTAVRSRLPEYLAPETITVLESLPLTQNGKLNRDALPEPDKAAPSDAFVAPRTDAETLVAGVFAGLLGLEEVGATDDFFTIGGNSLLAIRAIAQIRSRLEMEIPVRGLFSYGVVSELAAEVERRLDEELDKLSDDEVDRMLAEESTS